MPPKKTKLPKKEDVIKSLKGFVMDEDGFVSKDTILRIGLSTVAGMSVLGMASDAGAQNTTTHTNQIANTGCFEHTNTVTHSNY